MTGSEAIGTPGPAAPEPAPDSTTVGRHVVMLFEQAPDGEPFTVSAERAGTPGAPGVLVLEPARRAARYPLPGEEVACESVAGNWTTTVRSAGDGKVELASPEWLSRGVRRRWRREATSYPVTVRIAGEEWAGRLEDVSVGGGAVMVERASDLGTGTAVEVVLPSGTARATVRSVRDHVHPKLAVAGLAWNRMDPEARQWVGNEVARHRQRRPGPAGTEGAAT